MYFSYFQTVQLIDKTDADVKIFAGDVNALPFPGIINGKRQPYSLLTSILTDSLVDRYVFSFISKLPYFTFLLKFIYSEKAAKFCEIST